MVLAGVRRGRGAVEAEERTATEAVHPTSHWMHPGSLAAHLTCVSPRSLHPLLAKPVLVAAAWAEEHVLAAYTLHVQPEAVGVGSRIQPHPRRRPDTRLARSHDLAYLS